MAASNFKPLAVGFVSCFLVLFIAAFLADRYHSALPCLPFEKHERASGGYLRFERISYRFWSSLCESPIRPIVISASEGTGTIAFSDLLNDTPNWSNDMTGAHRGAKTLAYLFAHQINPERAKNLRLLGFINPVYFNFAASTDSSALQQTAISAFSYYSLIPFWHWRWDEYLLSSPWITLKEYYRELFSPRDFLRTSHRVEPSELTPIPDKEYNSVRQMFNYKADLWTGVGVRAQFSPSIEPTHTMMQTLADGLRNAQGAKFCMVLLPMNSANMRYFQVDPQEVTRELRAMMVELFPEGNWLDLTSMNDEPKVFMDPPHFTDHGKAVLMEKVKNSSCFKNVMAPWMN
jgi:hypothetical protein